jgi:SulP family sulfate permease
MLIPVSVLEGFSFGVAVTIGFGQFNNAFGLKGLKRHPEFSQNLYETFSNIDQLDFKAFLPFLLFFAVLFILAKFYKGKPWIILIAICGCLYGYALKDSDFKPLLLRDVYPEMLSPSIWKFDYFKNSIPLANIISGSIKVAFVGVLETLISARIADNLTSRFK